MRRCIVLLLALVAAAALGPGRAEAATPCRDKIFNEWYHDGKISSTFPLSCYRDALKHIPPDVKVYSSLGDDIQLALQAAVDRSHGKSVPSEVGSGTRLTSSGTSTSTEPDTSTTPGNPSSSQTTPVDTAPDAADPGGVTTTPASTTPVAAATPASSSSNGVPLPVVVLGGVALILVASGAIGVGVRRYRRSHPG